MLGIHLEITEVEIEKEFKPVIGHVNVKFDLYAVKITGLTEEMVLG
jgi:hypothetical protein